MYSNASGPANKWIEQRRVASRCRVDFAGFEYEPERRGARRWQDGTKPKGSKSVVEASRNEIARQGRMSEREQERDQAGSGRVQRLVERSDKSKGEVIGR